MRTTIFAAVLVATTGLTGAAMALDATGRPAQIDNSGTVGILAEQGGVFVPHAVPYVFQWSKNPEPVSNFTSDPGFVEHSHGKP